MNFELPLILSLSLLCGQQIQIIMLTSCLLLLGAALAFDDVCISHFYENPNKCIYDGTYIPTTANDYQFLRQYLLAIVETSIYTEKQASSTEQKMQKLLNKLVGELKTPTFNPTAHDFYDIKAVLEKSNLYSVLKKMPKGAATHIHTSSAVDVDFLVAYTQEPHYWIQKKSLLIEYSPVSPGPDYENIVEMRQKEGDEAVEQMLRNALLLNKEEASSGESEQIWDLFQYKFDRLRALFSLEQNFKKNVHEMLRELYEDGSRHVELRHVPGMIFRVVKSADGKWVEEKLSVEQEMELFSDAVEEFSKSRVDKFSVKLILCALKILHKKEVKEALEETFQMKQKFPHLVVGFDAVNEEDTSLQLDQLVQIFVHDQQLSKKYGIKMEYFYHAGESLESTNTNLIDAVMLQTRRIGHGFDLFILPKLVPSIRKRDIAIECCPFSNQILGYIKDLRSHPARMFMRMDLPVTISSDDPALYGYSGFTLDFTAVTVAWELSLQELKTLSLNSLKYSALEEKEKNEAMAQFEADWTQWLESTVDAFY